MSSIIPDPSKAIYDRKVGRRAVNLTINEDLLMRLKGFTINLSRTAECLLAGYLHQAQTRERAERADTRKVLTALDAFSKRCGFLSDEFSGL